MSTRGRVLAGLATTLVVLGVVVGVLFVGGRAGLGPLASGPNGDGSGGPDGNGGGSKNPPPVICPLSGLRPEEGVPNRPALAVKVENLPSARPQTGLSWADIVYEEPVEVGITRFIAVYQCRDASLIVPVRSARMTDPDILVQFGRPLLGYAGAVPEVVNAIRSAGIVDLSDLVVPEVYHRDPERERPHDLYTSTQELYSVADSKDGAPKPVFRYAKGAPQGGRAISEAFVPFSVYSDVSWRWSSGDSAWVRYDSGEPHALSDGTPITAKNVIVQMVEVVLTDIVDVNGARSPKVVSTGSGAAYVLRGGRVVEGTWRRDGLGEITRFFDANGREVRLATGNTWVELVPSDVQVTFA